MSSETGRRGAPVADAARPLGEERLGEYTLEAVLGRGGSSVVYRARHRQSGAVVALKRLSRVHPESLLRFKREFRVVADLDHPGLVKLFELVVEDGQSYLTMEWVDGSNLDELAPDDAQDWPTVDPDAIDVEASQGLPSAPPDVAALCRIMLAVTDALEALHLREILHRDLKPSNVLVTPDGQVRVCDFGLACPETDDDSCARVGTLSYMAPEQLRGERVGPAADRYALGGVLFRLLTGQHPVVGDVTRATEAKDVEGGLRPSRRVTGVPPLLDTLCTELLDPDPEARPSLDEVRAVLRHFADASGPAPVAWRTVHMLAGRDDEVARLTETLRQTRRGRPSLTIVSAPSGLGKSTLGEHIATYAEDLGFLVFSGRCYERERVPFNGFDALLDDVAGELRGWSRARREPLARALHSLVTPFPVLGLSLDGLGAPVIDRDEVARAMAVLVDGLASARPVLLVLDDLQWLSEESDRLLRELVQRSRGPVAFLGLTRDPVGWPDGEPAHRTRVHFALDPLDEPAVREVVETVAGEGLSGAELDALARAAGGSPLMAQRLALGWTSHDPATVSSASLGELILGSLRSLTVAERTVLDLSSAAGGEIERALLGRASELTEAHLELCLAKLKAQRLLTATHGGERIDVSHDQVREVLYESLETERMIAVHRALAGALAETDDPDPEALLLHWSAAGDTARRREALDAAAQRATDRHAPHRARQLLYERLAEHDAPAHPMRASWLDEASRLSERIGEYPAAIDDLSEAIGFLKRSGHRANEPRLLVMRARLGSLLAMASRFDEATRVFDEAFDDAGLTLARTPIGNAARIAAEQLAQALERVFRTPRGAIRFGSRHRAETDDRTAIEMLSLYGALVLPYAPHRAGEALVRAIRLADDLGEPHLARRYLPAEFARLLSLLPIGIGSSDAVPPAGWEGYFEREAGLALVETAPREGARRLERAARIYQTFQLDGTPEALVCHSALSFAYGHAGEREKLGQLGALLVARGDFHSRSMGHFVRAAEGMMRGDAGDVRAAADAYLSEMRTLHSRSPLLEAAMRRYAAFGTGHYDALLDDVLPTLVRRLRFAPTMARIEMAMFSVFAAARLALEGRLPVDHQRRLDRLARLVARIAEPYRRFVGHLCVAVSHHTRGERRGAKRALGRMRAAMPTDAADWERWLALRIAQRMTGLSGEDRALLEKLERAGFALVPIRARDFS